jgi:LCP family protein required for cell wall assembly
MVDNRGTGRVAPVYDSRTTPIPPVARRRHIGNSPLVATTGRSRSSGSAAVEGGAAAGTSPGLGRALLAVAAAAVLPGSGHLLLQRRRSGMLILAIFVVLVVGVAAVVITLGRTRLMIFALDTRALTGVTAACVAAALLWIAVVVRTYLIGCPPSTGTSRRVVGVTVVALLGLVVAVPFGAAAELAQSQRTLVSSLFPSDAAGAARPLPAQLNVLLFGSDAGSDRTGTRSDSMMVASVDTTTSRAVVFGLPRNIEHAPFPPGSVMAAKFPRGFFDPRNPLSGDYLLNAEYTYGNMHPELAPAEPSADRGLNLLMSSVGQMLGIPVNYYVKVDMAGFAAIIDAIGGVTINVGPVPLPIGGVLPDGTHVKPDGYVPAGVHHLDGNQALWYVRSRRNSDDYSRMSRQRCLIHTVLAEKSVTDLLTHFQAVAAATTESVSTDVPQSFLPVLATLAGDTQNQQIDSIAFDPSLRDPDRPDGRFDPADPDFGYMRQVVSAAIADQPAGDTAQPTTTTAAPSPPSPPTTGQRSAPSSVPAPLADSCTALSSPSPGGDAVTAQ